MVGDDVISIWRGEEVLDQVTLTRYVQASTALESEALDPTDNDDVANWFACEAPYGNDTKRPNTGTPGASNETCGDTDPPPPPPDSCIDGGRSRPIVPPGPDDLRISEYMANPDAVLDADGEWFEVQVLADVDLNGLQIGQTSDPYDADQTVDDKDTPASALGR